MLNNEQGIICHTDPLIMKCVDFHSYVPIMNRHVELIKKHYNDPSECHIKNSLITRIRDYLKSETTRG